ncbi:MAG: helicase-related protein [Halothece sp.]
MSSPERSTWFENRKSIQYITRHLQLVETEIRIASGFFTVKGWNLIRKYIGDKFVYLLIGINEPDQEEARSALIDEIMRELRTGLDQERRQGVQSLVEKMQTEELRLVDARATDHHAKLYLIDNKFALIASSNLTGKGLITQIEAGSVITEGSELKALIEEFDDYFAQAQDLTAELLRTLQDWLQLRTPWDIYLKTMLAFENINPPESSYSKKPISYQRDMIAQTLRQLKQYEGSMLVASTGLGKTVVAVNVAIKLREQKIISHVIVIGPKAVKTTWEKELWEAGLPCQYFIRQTFDKVDASQDKSLDRFEEIKELAKHQKGLLIIDESQEFRNRYKQDIWNRKKNRTERLAFQRLHEFSQTANLKVLLLTGSPYAKEIENINNQLFLLPHTAPSQSLFPELMNDAKAWKVSDTDEFIKLPVTSQLTTPYVAKYYAHSNNQGNKYIDFGETPSYLPKINLSTITFPLLVQEELSEAIINGYFNTKNRNPMFRKWCSRLVKIAWASSPLALQGVLECVIDTPGGSNSYKLEGDEFIFSRSERQEAIKPIIAQLKEEQKIDSKLTALLSLIIEKREELEKLIIFCERRATVVYLYQTLKKRLPKLKISCTIDKGDKENQYQMKETKEVEKIINKFAPIANNAKTTPEENIDIFISTDAYGVGVNMQDASIVVNYDIAWTPISPVQRAGRILRFWHSPRTVKIYTFVPTLNIKTASTIERDLIDIQKRWQNLIHRHGESKKLIDLPVLTIDQTEEIDLPENASQITIESGQLNLDALADVEISPFYQHTAKLQLNRDYAQMIPDDIISAKYFPEKTPCVYVLLFHHQAYYAVLYYPKTQKVVEPNLVQLLDLIDCDEQTETARIELEYIENLSNRAIKTWCTQKDILPEEVERICTLYLQPESEKKTFKEYLQQAQSQKNR